MDKYPLKSKDARCVRVFAGGGLYGGGFWLGPFISATDFHFASGLKATVVHSDEGTSFYLMTGFTL